ncbi:serine/threonine-protein kinase [Actinomadura sp. WAC 06369]|uniref:serine/threonine-protein kinase n=1 Tax=Actinomadura sp. WAC 06369 TaxID=2203193 RepID=UPI0018F700A3|nr:serine/threonine-protein kinase [Actinomadura sp. WAC 06369]
MTVVAGRYRLVRELGRGGMGRVWEADDTLLRRRVAVKEVLLPAGLDARERGRLCRRAVREARAAGRLDHPSIITVHDVFLEDDRPWIVMEAVAGRSLREALPVPPREAARIGAAVLDALLAAHRAGVLHRDVTPGNVLLGDDGRVVLTDFGIADLDGDPALTRTGTVVGSPGYIAPERLDGRGADGRSDLFSLGATLYTAVEGRSAFGRPSDAATVAATLTEPPPRPRRAGPLRPLLAGLLRKDPAARPDAERAAAALRAVAAGRKRRPGRGAPVLEVSWLAAVAVPAAVFLLPAYVTGPRGEARYPPGFRPCPMQAGALRFAAAQPALDNEDLRECDGGDVVLRWFEGYVGAYGRPVGPRHASVREAHRWLRFLSVHNVEEDERYPFDITEADADRPSLVTDRYRARRPRPLGGLADDAFVREVRAAGTGGADEVDEAEVIMRDANLVVGVLHRGGAGAPDARRAAEDAARAVLAELRRRR